MVATKPDGPLLLHLRPRVDAETGGAPMRVDVVTDMLASAGWLTKRGGNFAPNRWWSDFDACSFYNELRPQRIAVLLV